ncbi:unnamed protein product [Cunninghamella blakesleeana]
MEQHYLKDGKFSYFEPKLRPETHPFAATAIIDFREYRKRIEATELKDIPEENSLIPSIYNVPLTMIAQDSEESLQTLANRLNELLSPFNRNEMYSDLFVTAIEHRIKSIMTRAKYGLNQSIIDNIEGAPASTPSHFYVCRWESNDITQFPDDFKAFITKRRDQRRDASNALTNYFQSIQHDLQLSLLTNKYRKQQPVIIDESKIKFKTPEEMAAENEKQRKKEEERQKKEEERQRKEEERRRREEERQEERRKRELDKKKKDQLQLRISSLFTKNVEDKGPTDMEKDYISSRSMFPPFFIKENVTVHSMPTIKCQSNIADIIDYKTSDDIVPQESMGMKYKYLQELNNTRPQLSKIRGIHRKVDLKNLLLPGDSGSNLDAIHRPEYKQLLKMKFLQFTEDVRPAYYGTWTKQSNKIKGNRPFAKDTDILDYEHDSEAEWEPEGEGEDIQSGDDEDDETPEIADPEDVGWLVPEGYLSEGEGVDSDDDGMSKIVNRLSMRPNSRKKLTIRPVIIGPILENDDDMVENEALVALGVKTLINIDDSGYNPFAVIDNKPTEDTNKTAIAINSIPDFTEEHATELISVFEGKAAGLPKLLSEAKANPLLSAFPKTQLEAKIRYLAIKEKRGNETKPVWHIKSKYSTIAKE